MADKLIDQGATWERIGDRAKAAEAYRQAFAADPSNSKALTNLANVLSQEGRLEEAIAHYQRAIALDGQPQALNNLAWLHIAAGRELDVAARLADEAIDVGATTWETNVFATSGFQTFSEPRRSISRACSASMAGR